MRSTFARAISFTLQWEGGYSFDPHDPGGETNFGISKRAHPDLDVKALTVADAMAIYLHEYWEAIGCDDIPCPLDVAAFDSAVNCGPGWMRPLLATGIAWADLLDFRERRCRGIVECHPERARYLRGWLNRLTALRDLCKELEQP